MASSNGHTVTRRKLLNLAGAGTLTGLAGCSSNNNAEGTDGDNGDQGTNDGNNGDQGSNGLGERVPTLSIEYWSNVGVYTPLSEAALPTLTDNLENGLGIKTEVEGFPFSTQISHYQNDTRSYHAVMAGNGSNPERLGPQPLFNQFQANWAGGNGISNMPNYANCKFDEILESQANTMEEEERRTVVNEMQSLVSEECIYQPYSPYPLAGAYRPDSVNLDNLGDAGITATNTPMLSNLSSNADEVSIGITNSWIENRNFITISIQTALYLYLTLVHSPLIQYGSDLERFNVLAESIDIEGETVTVELKDDLQFHNGDKITSEDVEFTLKQNKAGAEAGVYGLAQTPPYESFNIVDETTLEINFKEPYSPFKTFVLPSNGIYHKQSWVNQGARENPSEFPWDPAIGSGPYQLETFEANSFMRLTPFEDHPLVGDKFNPDVDLVFRGYRNEETRVRALQEDEIQMVLNISPGSVQRLNNDNEVEASVSPGWSVMFLCPSYPVAPTKFKEFRQAMAACPNRKEMTQVALRGELEPMEYSNAISPVHPWYASEDELYHMAPPEGDFEKAKKILQDAGWGWDDQGRLHYPPDADLSPRWPEGETPSPEEFPCIDES